MEFRKMVTITLYTAATAAKLLQLCPTLCDPIDSGPPGYPVPGILQARTQRPTRLPRPWYSPGKNTAAHQATPSLVFSRQEHWSGLPFPSPMHEREKGK